MSEATEIRAYVGALRRQGWNVSLSADSATWRAVPPEKGRQPISFSAHPKADGSAQALRDLRAEGFQWPEAQRSNVTPIRSTPSPAPAPAPAEEEAAEPQPASPPTEPAVAPPSASLPAAKPAAPETAAYSALKEAKQFAELARQELAEAKRSVERAEATLAAAEETAAQATADLRKKKLAFDALFEASMPAEGGRPAGPIVVPRRLS